LLEKEGIVAMYELFRIPIGGGGDGLQLLLIEQSERRLMKD